MKKTDFIVTLGFLILGVSGLILAAVAALLG